MREQYTVKKQDKPVDWTVTVPGSKSMSNRALLMAALSNGVTEIEGVLFSEDSRYFIGSLQALGFEVTADEIHKKVSVTGAGGTIPEKEAEIYVGSAGTAARFLTAMLGMSDGKYIVSASEQMKKRPMKELFILLEQAGAGITYLEKEGFLPVEIVGRKAEKKEDKLLSVSLDISKSTQFLSAMLLISPMLSGGLSIEITSEKKDGSYIRITRDMMKKWGVDTGFDGKKYSVAPGAAYHMDRYIVEPDMSAACYFYGAAAITGGRALVRNVHADNTQGDLKFLEVLEKLGCTVSEQEEGIAVTGPGDGKIKGIEIDMNDFSDQTMTLAAMAPFASEPVRIFHIGHIRLQESDRIHAIVTELTRMGIRALEEMDAVTIYPGIPHAAVVETYDDHRMAMAFSLIGLKTEGIVIDNPACCKKTFEHYFTILSELTDRE